MTEKKLTQALKKAGFEPFLRTPDVGAVKFGQYELTWERDGARVVHLVFRDTAHVHNPWEDYCSFVWFPKTIRDAVNCMTESVGRK